MLKVSAFIRPSKSTLLANVRFRLTDGKKTDITHTSEFQIHPNDFDAIRQFYKKEVNVSEDVKLEFDKCILQRKQLLLSIYNSADTRIKLDSRWINQIVANSIQSKEQIVENEVKSDKLPEPVIDKISGPTLIGTFSLFVEKHRVSNVRLKNFRVILRALKRYEHYKLYGKKLQPIMLKDITPGILSDIEVFFRNEHDLAKLYPYIIMAVPESRTPQPRGENTISDMMTKFRTFILWAIRNGIISVNPFLKYEIKGCVYGSPYYLTIEEIKHLYQTDLSSRPRLAEQRDIFVFHSMCGARVSDLHRMTPGNIIDDAIVYIPSKTMNVHANALVVPLNDITREIVNRYRGGDKLLPFGSEQHYNRAIKEMLTLAKITRKVVVLNSLTRQEQHVPINKVASSHMCRRNMIGCLYNLVQDTALISALSGHSPNSKAFLRYRNVEMHIKKNLMDQLNF